MNSPGRRGLIDLIYDPKVRSVTFQAVTLLSLVGFVWWVINNTVENLARQGKRSGFDFLGDTAGFDILPTLGTAVVGYELGVSTYWDVFWVGVVNTLIVAFLGVIGATILGFLIGVFRLSSNVVIRSFATVYIEICANVPLLLQLFFWYFFVLRALPGIRERGELFGGAIGINVTGLYFPLPIPLDGSWPLAVAFVVGVIAWLAVSIFARRRQIATGQQTPVFLIGLSILFGLLLVTYFASGQPIAVEMPVFKEDGPIIRRGFQDAGLGIKPEMLSVWLALTLYASSFIAEIVRAGILAVPNGQTEAAYSCGMRPGPTLNLVILPQALRVIIPPLTSQYLNLTKNSSLSVAIAYPDVVSTFAGTALNQVGREIEVIFMMMMVYLFLSLVTSMLMNWFNARMKLVER